MLISIDASINRGFRAASGSDIGAVKRLVRYVSTKTLLRGYVDICFVRTSPNDWVFLFFCPLLLFKA